MSAPALGAAEGLVAAGEQAAAQRVAQLQALVAQTRQMVGGGAQDSGAPAAEGFAAALRAAGGEGAAGTQQGYGIAAEPYGAAGAYTAYAPSASSYAGYQTPVGAAGATPYDGLIQAAAARYGLDPAVLHGLVQQESGFNPNATSAAGAMGLTQLMPGTASSLGVSDPMNPAEAVEGGALYLSRMLATFGGNTAEALAAYNAGPGAVQRYGGVPPYPETQAYVANVLGYAEAYRRAHGTPTVQGAIA